MSSPGLHQIAGAFLSKIGESCPHSLIFAYLLGHGRAGLPSVGQVWADSELWFVLSVMSPETCVPPPAALQPVAAWTQWFTRLLLGSLYPGAPFERKFMAMLLLETLLTTWNTPDKANRRNFRCPQHRLAHILCCSAQHEGGWLYIVICVPTVRVPDL